MSQLLANGFQTNLAFGRIAESRIARWFIKRGCIVIPTYDIEYETGKGPRAFYTDGQVVLPDLQVISGKRWIGWIEAKHKSVFTWHRISSAWTTGIDLHHYADYLKFRAMSQMEIWLLFLHESASPDGRDVKHGCPGECPTGLFGNNLEILERSENHRHANHGKHGMVYWRADSLARLANLEECPS